MKIQQELTKLTGEKTTFIIAHRISSVREADQILMMEKDESLNKGPMKNLSVQGKYYEVYQKQLGLSGGEDDGEK